MQNREALKFLRLSDGIRLKSIKLTLKVQIMQNSRAQSCAGQNWTVKNMSTTLILGLSRNGKKDMVSINTL